MALPPDIAEHLQVFNPQTETDSARAGGVGDWLEAARSEAEKRLCAAGLPHRRDEYWKYTDPGAFLNHHRAPPAAPDSVPPLLGDAACVTNENGAFAVSGTAGLKSQRTALQSLDEAAGEGGCAASRLFGRLEAAAHDVFPRGLAAANTCRASRGLIVECGTGGRAAVQLIHRPWTGTGGSVLHHVIEVQPGAELLFAESGADAGWSNTVFEVRVGAGAALHLVRAARATGPQPASICSVFADVEASGRFNLFNLSAGSPWCRNECVVRLQGDHAMTNLAGAVLGGQGCHHDDTVLVIHEGEHCQSRQVFKKALRNGAKGVFQGKIHVKPGAQKTDGYQISQGLLLDDSPQFLAKPELEIYADDVACSHGSTSGGIDSTAMFYLRSRGIREPEAQELLTMAFIADAVNEVEDGQLRNRLQSLAGEWFAEVR